jgi:hypothetical protein
MNENIERAIIAGQTAIVKTLGNGADRRDCLQVVALLAHPLLTDFGKNNKKVSFHNLDFFHHELEAMILDSRANPHAHH